MYNGYENKPTWLVALWINNEEGPYYATRNFLAKNKVENLPDFVWEMYQMEDIGDSGLATDLFQWAWMHINWDEVMNAVIGD